MKLCLFLYLLFFLHASSDGFTPAVVMIPGLGGSVLQTTEDPPTRVWPPSLFSRTPIDIVCDPDCRSLHPIQSHPIGDPRGIRVDTFLTYLFTGKSYYAPLVRSFQEHSIPVSALPYDFRLIYPNALDELYLRFRHFLEQQGQPVIVIAHSLGGLLFHDFLIHTTSREWQERHLHQILYVNVPFGGVPNALYHTLHNLFPMEKGKVSSFCVPRIPSLHDFAGLLWCMPLLPMDVLRWKQKSYPGGEDGIHTFYKDLNRKTLQSGWTQYRSILKRRETPPSAPTFILYGTGTQTTCFRDWDTGYMLTTDGDGTVPTESHLFCEYPWKKQSNHIHYLPIPGMGHNEMLPEHIFPFLSLL